MIEEKSKEILDAEPSPTAGTRTITQKEQDFISLAKKRRKLGLAAMDDTRERMREHNKFIVENDPWPQAVKDDPAMKGRLMVALNNAPQAIDRVVGEIRQNPPRGKARPVDSNTDPKMANVITAICKHVERNSNAPRIYCDAIEQPATNTAPAWLHIETDYVDDETGEQEIYIRHIKHQASVVLDPDMIAYAEPHRGGAKWGFIDEMVPKEQFRERYPKAAVLDVDQLDADGQGWYTEDNVRVSKYYVGVARQLAVYEWRRADSEQRKGYVIEGTKLHDEIVKRGFESELKEVRKVTRYKISHYIISGSEILEGPEEYRGSFVPIVPVEGKTFYADGKAYTRGVVTQALDAMMIENFAWSRIIEAVALAPKGKWIGTNTMFGLNPDQWKNANLSNDSSLTYAPDPLAPQNKPEYVRPYELPQGSVQLLQLAIDQRKALQSVHDAQLGAQSNETSGRAINAREQQMQSAHYALVDNLAESIRYAWRIIIDLIPHYYDTQKVIRVYGDDDRPKEPVTINQPSGQIATNEFGETVQKLLNDVTVGRYDVDIDMGPSFRTQRQETLANMTQLASSVPVIGQLGADFILRLHDVPGVDDFADRIKAWMAKQGMIDPNEGTDDKTRGAVEAATAAVKQQAMQAFQAAEQTITQLQQAIAEKDQQLQAATEAMKNKAAELELKRAEIDQKKISEKVRADADVEIARLNQEQLSALEPLQKEIVKLHQAVAGMQAEHAALKEYAAAKPAEAPEKTLMIINDLKSGRVVKHVSLKTPEGKEYTGTVEEDAGNGTE